FRHRDLFRQHGAVVSTLYGESCESAHADRMVAGGQQFALFVGGVWWSGILSAIRIRIPEHLRGCEQQPAEPVQFGLRSAEPEEGWEVPQVARRSSQRRPQQRRKARSTQGPAQEGILRTEVVGIARTRRGGTVR